MREWKLWKWVFYALLMVVVLGGAGRPVAAETSTSPHYQVTGTDFNAVSSQQSCSDKYCAKVSLGDVSTGMSSAGGSAATFGTITDGEPLLEVIVEQGPSSLGTLTTEKTGTKTMTVQVRTYLSGGYTLQVVGAAPKYGDHTLATLTSPTASTTGTEQFGLNVVANTTPSIGADPVQMPSGDIKFGQVTDDYKTPNRFKYIDGDVVARSNSLSGQTNYTISMIVNISNATPAGHYAGDYAAIVTPAY